MATENLATTTADNPEQDLSLRDEIDAAWDQHEQPTDDVSEEQLQQLPQDDRPRDQLGRFATKPAGKPAGSPQEPRSRVDPGQGSQPAAGGAPGPQELKPPASWRPEVREKWAGVDPLVRQEIHRREWEHQHSLQDAAAARQFVQAFEATVRPYEMFIRAENSNPLQAVQSLMSTAAQLRVGTPQAKAQLVAGLVSQYGIDIQTLDNALVAVMGGQPVQGQQALPQTFRDPRFDQFLAAQQKLLQQQEAQEDAEIRQSLSAFAADPRHEFYRDVAPIMADIIEIRARQNLPQADIEAVYAQACQMHDGVRTILAQRGGASAAGTPNRQAVLRAKRAAVSIKSDSTPDGATTPRDDSLRAAIEAAFDANEG